jgi:ketosteroid isomerase-like protein
MSDEDDVRQLLKNYDRAILEKNADAMIDCYSDDVVGDDLASPHKQTSQSMRNPNRLQQWFDSWEGPIHSVPQNPMLRVDGDCAYSTTLLYLTGTKKDGEEVDFCLSSTAMLRKTPKGWKITQIQNSVPFAMDGSHRALVDLSSAA